MLRGQFPTSVAHQLYKLVRQEGVAKISYSLVSMNLPQQILKTCMQVRPLLACVFPMFFVADGQIFVCAAILSLCATFPGRRRGLLSTRACVCVCPGMHCRVNIACRIPRLA